MTDPRRALPSVTALLALESVQLAAARTSRPRLVRAVRAALDEARRSGAAPMSDDAWGVRVRSALEESDASPRPVINATGVVLHTNLGRAPLADEAIRAVRDIAAGYCDLELDLASGERGGRQRGCVESLCVLTGAADACVVNNGAAGLIVALHALAGGRPVAVSRGELVEIGGSFRIPEIMRAAGVTLLEVGTTNRTHLSDYAAALDAGAGGVLKVHRSNFRMSGFVAEVPIAELAPLCRARGVPLVHDFGSGLLLRLDEFGLTGEPIARDVVRAGATVTIMSGDKLLGGPQAGILLGDAAAVAAARRDPLARAVRADKLTIAALDATLRLYDDLSAAVHRIPALRMITAPASTLHERAEAIVDRLRHAHVDATVVGSDGAVGAGAFPDVALPSAAIALDGDATTLAERLRTMAVPVVGRIRDGRLRLDLRSVPERDDDLLGDAVVEALA